MNFYSNNGVDVAVAPLLPPFGYAIDVGANDGVYASNSKHFEDKGWIVYCVEPNPMLETSGRQNRKLWRKVACGMEDRDEVDFVACGKFPFSGGSGFHTSTALEVGRIPFKVKMRRLDRLIVEAGFPRIDFLTIDAERHDLEVLQGLNLEVWRPIVICIECLGDEFGPMGYFNDQDVVRYLEPYRYRLHGAFGYDRVFVRNP